MNVIVGAGLAAVRAAEALREGGSSEPIVMISSERELPYEKPPLSKELLRGEMTIEQARIHDEAFYRTHQSELVLGSAARSLNVRDRTLQLDGGRELPFRQLLIATGSTRRHDHPGCSMPVAGAPTKTFVYRASYGCPGGAGRRLTSPFRVVIQSITQPIA
jgi:3-phenylpropionate/trans-cinnamate dioxygenase ferredoxin reductase component